jgi:4-diphosphocytidyl-2-C-methyl-D-erythritol kinase
MARPAATGLSGVADPLRRLTPVVRLAPAKLNLTLAITGRRADGFHELHSVMVPLALSDRLSAAISGAPSDTLHVRGADAGPVADNLVLRAIAATRAAVGRGWPRAPAGGAGLAPALAVRLEKAIPVAAGLAGGSSDAAAAIDAALEAWDADRDEDRRRAVAARLGSDVPFFLAGSPAVVEGRGEAVTALPGLRGSPAGILLVTPALHVSTADVFAAYTAGARPRDPGSTRMTSQHLAQEWRSGLDADRLFQRAGVLAPANDLLAATALVAPDVVATRRALVRLLGRPVGQSGSGPTCWVLYPSLADAASAADRVNEALRGGLLRVAGDGPPFVHATTIAAAAGTPTAESAQDTPIPPGGVIRLDSFTADERGRRQP